MLAGCGGLRAPSRVIAPYEIMATSDPRGSYLAVGDSALFSMRSVRGVRVLDVTITDVDLRADGTWRVAGCIDDGWFHLPTPHVRVAFVRVWRTTSEKGLPEDGMSGIRFFDPSVGRETPWSFRLEGSLNFDPRVRTETAADGTFELSGLVDAATCLIAGGAGDYVELYPIGLLLGE